ncbi:hypothetical protein MESS2_1230023 [Mesorhizobium metallidurans STM 2683]|uniref:Uncharacterized protein n=1 Tax=Mesorhizobium metallidurans STM 2683 TaxID=1297569 RepID=M5EIL0_9HYPH|nr:hypothetical protein MESS2_1230023 [Mesorhizobium metallidurans STM 2683]
MRARLSFQSFRMRNRTTARPGTYRHSPSRSAWEAPPEVVTLKQLHILGSGPEGMPLRDLHQGPPALS